LNRPLKKRKKNFRNQPQLNPQDNVMENAFTKVEELASTVKEYVTNSSALVKFTIAEKSSLFIANLLAFLAILMFITFFIGFSSLALATWLANYLGSSWIAYLIVACIHLIVAFLLWLLRSRLIRFPFMNALLKQSLQSDEKDK